MRLDHRENDPEDSSAAEPDEQFAARLEVLPFSAKAAAHFGQITNNAREFERMPGLRLDKWAR